MGRPETKKHPFVSHLEARAQDRAMLAALRRGLGAEPGEEPAMYPHVVPWINEWREEADIYMIASLFALHPASASSGNMGRHCRSLDPNQENDPTERRFVQLLRMRRETLEPRLRQQISILKSNDVPVNWHQLIADLRNWDHPDRFVQRRWAGDFWRAQPSKSKSTEERKTDR